MDPGFFLVAAPSPRASESSAFRWVGKEFRGLQGFVDFYRGFFRSGWGVAHVASMHVPLAHSYVTFHTELHRALGDVTWPCAQEAEETGC